MFEGLGSLGQALMLICRCGSGTVVYLSLNKLQQNSQIVHVARVLRAEVHRTSKPLLGVVRFLN